MDMILSETTGRENGMKPKPVEFTAEQLKLMDEGGS